MRILPITGVALDAEQESLDQDSAVDWDPKAFDSFLVDMEQEEAFVAAVAIDPLVLDLLVDLVLEHAAVVAAAADTLPSVVVASVVAVDATFAVVEVLVEDLLDDIRVENLPAEVAFLDTLVLETVASLVPVAAAAVVVAVASFAFSPAVAAVVAHRTPAFVAAVAAAVVAVAVVPMRLQRLPLSVFSSASFSFSVAQRQLHPEHLVEVLAAAVVEEAEIVVEVDQHRPDMMVSSG